MKLCEVLKQYRWAIKIGLREMAKEIGFSASTLSRVERGELPSGPNLAKLLCWLLKEDSPEETSKEVDDDYSEH